ncbi:hypothetical protein KVR01_001040 [Diaporthe batatas]|uniref:uncharacterized protein n=1 Tax=Diaporthe batatas TaxID=748121 RepID=UPI001D04EF39|nr:uncharacterized protein KVR01_001040 [Diaporthe batatas]KAG8170295.1 hypothetical protein KVR01_001040 [Diaporthe batatas]
MAPTATRLFFLLGLLGLGQAFPRPASLCDRIRTEAVPRLSPKSTVQCNVENERWSEYAIPKPGAIITAGTEDDVAVTVAFSKRNNIKFLVQSGANGWANTFNIGPEDVVIDTSGLKAISFNAERTQVTFQAGVLIQDLVNAAWENNARVSTGTCNCVSVLGAGLGGGIGRTQGLYGHGVDQLLSITYVDANGRKSTVTAKSDPDLWWAFAGAGPNFGIVTSVVFKSYPVAQADNIGWTGSLVYSDSQLEDLIVAMDNLELEPEMQLDFTFTQGAVILIPFYIGGEEAAREKFAPLLDIGPLVEDTTMLPYNSWSSGADSFCVKGGRKPSYGVNVQDLSPTAWRNVWNEYASFTAQHAEANLTTILSECYSTDYATSNPNTSYPWRGTKCYVTIIPWYTNPALDGEANQFGQNIRSYLSSSSGLGQLSSYINFAHGDEPLSSIYGDSLSRLQKLKRKYDPSKRFNQWFPLS